MQLESFCYSGWSRIIPAPFSFVGNIHADTNSTYSVIAIREVWGIQRIVPRCKRGAFGLCLSSTSKAWFSACVSGFSEHDKMTEREQSAPRPDYLNSAIRARVGRFRTCTTSRQLHFV
jgi:hypothetical protein